MLPFIALLLGIVGLSGAAGAQVGEWTLHRNERFGFSFRYPADVFALERSSETGDGEVFAGARGQGRLLVGAFANDGGHSVETYRRYVAKNSYAGFGIHYAPRGQTWFVLSGEDAGRVFYEKVMFSCGGRLINSFVIMYPIENKREFDPIVSGIEKTFRPGQDCSQHASQP